jgi:hypothetical protein
LTPVGQVSELCGTGLGKAVHRELA